MLPEDLRSSIVKNYGRRLIKEYTDDLLVAVAFWRQAGAWRSKLRKNATAVAARSTPAIAGASGEHNVIALAERRRAPVVTSARHSDVEEEYTLEQPMTAAG